MRRVADMTTLTDAERAALNLLAGGRLFRTASRRFYGRRNSELVDTRCIVNLAYRGLVDIFSYHANGRLVTAARLTMDGQKARSPK